MIVLLPLVHPPYKRHGHQPVLLIHLLHSEQRPVRMPDQTRRGHLGPTKLERGRRGDLQDVRLEAVIDVEDDHVVEFDTVRRWDGGRNRGGRVRPMMGELVELVELVESVVGDDEQPIANIASAPIAARYFFIL